MSMQGYHKSVLLGEVIEALHIEPGKWYLDCTLGDGGHAIEIIRQGGKVLGIDVDPEGLTRAKDRLESLGPPVSGLGNAVLVQGNFRDIKNLIEQTDILKSNLAGAIFDLGVSSLQLETPQRGFSFGKKGPLDMRMDPTLQVRALDLINAVTRKELYGLFSNLGEEKYSWQLADAVVRARQIGAIVTTQQLAQIILLTTGGMKGKIHPATRVFQALRIAVNDELKALEEGLDSVKDLIVKGRIVVISFHSLEDRIVKNTYKKWQLEGMGQILTKKPVSPSESEVLKNPRSRSAKMRVFEKI